MKMAISNIAWDPEMDNEIYALMKEYGYSGLEIAPTRILAPAPYERLYEAWKWKMRLVKQYNFDVPSMQSIWFGRTEQLFGGPKERAKLLAYTQEAIDFAAVIECRNLVFGCPKNRNVPEGVNPRSALPFFEEAAKYASERGIVIGLEANPPIYGTNYINSTIEALDLIEQIDSEGLRLNLDIGTMVQNEESPRLLEGKVHLLSHVHVSEPMLAPVRQRELHHQIAEILAKEGYDNYISIEMKKQTKVCKIEAVLMYVSDVFRTKNNS